MLPATKDRNQRKKTGRVKPNRLSVMKNAHTNNAKINVHSRIWSKKRSKGMAEKASIKKNLGILAESRQCAVSGWRMIRISVSIFRTGYQQLIGSLGDLSFIKFTFCILYHRLTAFF